MTQWLATSFWGLPSRRHRHMFLDAAVLLRGQPLQDLCCAWIAMLQCDGDLAEDPDAAACIVSACIAELVASSLVTISPGRPRNHYMLQMSVTWQDEHYEPVQRCGFGAVCPDMLTALSSCTTSACCCNYIISHMGDACVRTNSRPTSEMYVDEGQ